MATRELPVELLLQILEWLLASQDKVAYRAAAALAQSCTALRASREGQRARYFHAFGSHSVPVPNRLPQNADYELEVLRSSCWPHEDPVDDADKALQVRQTAAVGEANVGSTEEEMEDAIDSDTVEAYLRGSTTIVLDAGRQTLRLLVAEPLAVSEDLRCYMDDERLPTPFSIARPEAVGLHQVIRLESKVTLMSVDDDGDNCLLLYAEEKDRGKEVVEIRSLESGIVRASFCLSEATQYDICERVTRVSIVGGYFSLERWTGSSEVRRWKLDPQEPQSECPLLWSANPQAEVKSVYLLAPHFLVVNGERTYGDGDDEFHFYRLGQMSSLHIVTLEFPSFYEDTSSPDYMRSGGKAVPGEEGLVVVQLRSSIVSSRY